MYFNFSKSLSRRTFLKGAGAAMALPWLEAMTPAFASAAANAPRECLAMDLREALGALGTITGETTPDEILDQIFGRFCIGK